MSTILVNDYGMASLTKSCFSLGSRIWNYRKQLQFIQLSLDKVSFRASLIKLRKGCAELIERIDKVLEGDAAIQGIQAIEDETFEITIRPGTHGQMFRFTFPKKQGQRLGLELGDKAVIKIESIKKQVEVV